MSGIPFGDDTGRSGLILRRITIAAGFVTAVIGGLGLAGFASGITVFTSVLPGYKPIAVSAALIWIFLGLVLVLHATRPHSGRLALIVRAVIAGIVIIEAIELPFSLMGSYSLIEILSVRVSSTLFGSPTTPISPAASAMIIPAGIALFVLLAPAGTQKRNRQIQDGAGVIGLAVALIAFTLVLSYVYGAPLLYNTELIPIAFPSALAGFFTGSGLVAAAGPEAIPLKYFTGSSTRARLLRIFVPFVIVLTLAQNIIFLVISDVFRVQDALLLSVCIVVFGSVTALVIARFSGRIGSDLERAEHALVRKNEDLGAMNEELTAITEELRQNNDELLRNEKALRESQQRNTFLADILDKSAQPFGVGYSDGKLGIVNRAFEELTGYSADELRGIDWVGILTPQEWLEAEWKSLEELHRTKKPVRYEKEYIRKDGTRVAIELLVHLVAKEDGSPQYYYSFITDISERKGAEEILNITLQRLNTLVSSMRVGILLLWEDTIELANQTFCDYFELRESPSELIGLTQREMIEKIRNVYLHPEEEVERIREIVRRGQPVIGEEVAMQKGRSYLRDFIPIVVDGKLQGRLWYHMDITERKRAEEELLRRNEDLNAAYEEITATQEELQQSNDELIKSEQELRKTSQYLENLINYANAPIVVWDPHFKITRFNHAFEELTGRTAREIIGQRLEVLFPQHYLDASMEIIRKTMNGERLKVVEIPILNRKGEIRIVLWNSATLFEADGKTVLSTIAQGTDITERKRAEEELHRRNEDLNAANEEIMATQEELQQNVDELSKREHELNEVLKEKEVLLSEVHHRVKNNLTAFISLLSLESAYDDSPAGLALKKDLQNRARSMALIHETLYRTKKYSRVNMDVYLSTLVGQVVSSFESGKPVITVVDTHGITLDLSRATPCGLIINEILTNSLKYAFPASFDCEKIRGTPCTITVSLAEDDGTYILTVRDNGIGLPEDLDIATTKTLGLKLVNFLAKHQLRASIEVHPEEGAEFRFRFRDKI